MYFRVKNILTLKGSSEYVATDPTKIFVLTKSGVTHCTDLADEMYLHML